jgi:hypothetical protein
MKKTVRFYMITILSLLVLSGCAEAKPLPQSAPAGQPEPTATEAFVMEANATEHAVEPTAAYQPGENDVCDNIYYPIVNGASWTYDLSVGGQATYSMAVNEDRSFTITIQSKDSTVAMDGRCSDDGIVLLDVPGVSMAFTDGDGGSTITTNAQDGVTLPNDIQLGDDWSQSISMTATSSDGQVILSAQLDTTYTALAYEQVDTPAGSFYALKVDQAGKMTMNGNDFDTHGFIWYAQGVGPVKSSIDDTNSTQLAAYNIP